MSTFFVYTKELRPCISYGMCDGMQRMTYRTTFALDQTTSRRLKRLASTWQVSQAEVVRRAVAMAEEATPKEKDPASLLKRIHQSGTGLVRERAEEYLAHTKLDRREWRSSE